MEIKLRRGMYLENYGRILEWLERQKIGGMISRLRIYSKV